MVGTECTLLGGVTSAPIATAITSAKKLLYRGRGLRKSGANSLNKFAAASELISGELVVTKQRQLFEMDFPARPTHALNAPPGLPDALCITPLQVFGSEEDLTDF